MMKIVKLFILSLALLWFYPAAAQANHTDPPHFAALKAEQPHKAKQSLAAQSTWPTYKRLNLFRTRQRLPWADKPLAVGLKIKRDKTRSINGHDYKDDPHIA